MLRKWKSAIDKGDCISAVLTEFSKVFDTINQDLGLVKLKAYVFSKEALNLVRTDRVN